MKKSRIPHSLAFGLLKISSKRSEWGDQVSPSQDGRLRSIATMDFFTILAVILVVSIIIKVYAKMTMGSCQSQADLSGKTVIVTGANSGIGYATAMDLATRNARLILACRSLQEGKQAAQNIQNETGNMQIVVKEMDLADFDSVRKFAVDFNQEEQRLDILVNNAGIPNKLSKVMTKNGHELTMSTNYFGPFLLTNLLLDKLKKSAPSRVVNTSSSIHRAGVIDFENLNSEKYYRIGMCYADTKLCNVLFSRELSHRMEGTGVASNALEPGSVNTAFFNNMSQPLKFILNMIASLFFRTPEEGAQTTIHVAVSEELNGVSGKYFAECKIAQEAQTGMDDAVAKKLWEVTEKIVGLI